jgi:serine/threonine protein phosphatase 1
MTKRTIAIGDIHGCSIALQSLLAAIRPQPDDTIVTMGDYVDRGPDSRGVLDQLVRLVDQCELIPLLGNHEFMLLESMCDPEMHEFWQSCGGDSTVASYGGRLENLPDEHLVFLRGLRIFHEMDKWIFVHANYDEQLPIEQTPLDLLLWEHINSNPPGQHMSGKRVVVGHTPQAEGNVLDVGHLVCLDTYCFGGGWLTAMDMDTGQLWQTDQRGQLRHG